MPFVKAGSLAALPPGKVMEAFVGDERYAICNAGGELHALTGACPHRGGPLGQGALHDHQLVCPWHAWSYDCRSGENDFDPTVRLAKFAVRAEGDDILIEVP